MQKVIRQVRYYKGEADTQNHITTRCKVFRVFGKNIPYLAGDVYIYWV